MMLHLLQSLLRISAIVLLYVITTLIPIVSYSQSDIYLLTQFGKLYKSNVESCSSLFIGNTSLPLTDIAINPVNGTLYGITESGAIYTINPITAQCTKIASTNLFPSTSLTCASNGNLYIALYTPNTQGTVFCFNATTLQTTPVVKLNADMGASGDLTFYMNKLYFSSTKDHLIEIKINDNNEVTDLGLFQGISQVFGVVSTYKNCDTKMLASSGRNLYSLKIPSLQGTTLCNDIVPYPIYGAASITESNPEVKIEPVAPQCITNEPIQLISNNSTGIWSSTSGSCITPDGKFDPKKATLGFNTISYTVCNKVYTTKIEVKPIPNPEFEFETYKFCQNLNFVKPTHITTELGKFSGSTGLQIDEISGTIDLQNSTAAIHTVTYETTVNGCSAKKTRTMEVQKTPSVDLNFPTKICESVKTINFDFNTTANQYSNIEWNFGMNSNPKSSDTKITTNVSMHILDEQAITLSGVFDECAISITSKITLIEGPKIDFLVKNEKQCIPFEAHFINLCEFKSELIYAWDFGDGTSSTEKEPTHLYTKEGKYPITLTITSTTSSECNVTLNLNKPDLIDVHPKPTSKFETSTLNADQCNAAIAFTNLTTDFKSLYYLFDEGKASTDEINPTFTYKKTGTIHPKQVVTTEFGCTDSSSISLYIEPFSVYFPNSFTPNGDQDNGTFSGTSSAAAGEWKLIIYNRWGIIVFESSNQNQGWDGKMNALEAPNDVYLYHLFYKACNSQDAWEEINGHVNLIR